MENAPHAIPAIVILLLMATWLVSEFRAQRSIRMLLGLLVMVPCLLWATLAGFTSELEMNMWFGGATRDLIHESVEQLEQGNVDHVTTVFRGLSEQYEPTYEYRANYDVLVNEAVARLRGDVAITPGDAWDVPASRKKIWAGYWEGEDHDVWMVITGGDYRALRVVWHDHPGTPVEEMSLSEDETVMTFLNRIGVEYTLTLTGPREVTLSRAGSGYGAPGKPVRLHKFVRPSMASQDTPE